MSDEHYGDWTTICELGRGGQGVVYLATKGNDRNKWAQEIRDGVITMARESSYPSWQEAAESVYKAIEKRITGGDYATFGAIKIPHTPNDPGPKYDKAKDRRRNELQALSSLNKPNLIRVLDQDKDLEWVVCEYFRGGTLADHPDIFRGDPLGAVRALVGLADATHGLHCNNIVHRDIKPANIFIRNGNELVLGDLGLVYSTDDSRTRVTDMHERVGTRDWMPTWAQGDVRLDNVTFAFDVFALGKLLWAMIAGDPFMQLHYFDRPKFNLCKRFQNRPEMEIVNKFLSKCVVEDEEACIHSAGKLHHEAAVLLQQLQMEEARRCTACGRGRYIGDAGASTSGHFHFWCERCGHVCEFVDRDDFSPPDWVMAMRDR